jgi:hypothetical protein
MIFEITYSLTVFILILLFLRYRFLKKPISGLKVKDLYIAFTIKCLASLVFIYLFTYYYGIGFLYYDSGVYMDDAKILNDVFYKSPINYFKFLTGIGETTELINHYLSNTNYWSTPNILIPDDAKNVIRINSIIYFFSGKVNFIHFMIFNLLSLHGLKNIYLFFSSKIKFNKRLFFYSILLLPNLLFWGSAVLKEPLLIFAIGFLLSALMYDSKKVIRKILFLLLSVVILLSIKAYILLALIIPFSFYFLGRSVFTKFKIMKSFLTILGFSSACFLLFPTKVDKLVEAISFKQFDFDNTTRGGIYFDIGDDYIYTIATSQYLKIVQKDYSFYFNSRTKCHRFLKSSKTELEPFYFQADSTKIFKIKEIWGRANSYVKPTLIFSSKWRMFYTIPEVLVKSLFRPQFNDQGPRFSNIMTLETWAVFLLLLFAIILRRKLKSDELLLLISLAIFVVILSLLIGWTITAFGAIVRYRIPVYLAIVIISFIIIKPINEWKKKKIIS